MIFFNPTNKACKSTIGGIVAGVPITLAVFTDVEEELSILIRKEGDKVTKTINAKKTSNGFSFELKIEESGLYWYCFSLGNGRFLGASANLDAVITETPIFYQLTVYDDFDTPAWLKGGVMYQIFPDRFCRSKIPSGIDGRIIHNDLTDDPVYLPNAEGEITNNDFFGGDFQGIISKLDYLKNLGVTVLYLNPIFKAYSNHRYDTGDYMQIDKMLGTEEDFKQLVSAANEKGIKIILDGVFNHTGSDSVYFNKNKTYGNGGAYNDKNSPYFKWYTFKNYPDEYESWWGIKTLPAVNESEESYVNFITGENGVLSKYTAFGIGGWRLDVADELPDSFIAKIRNAVKSVNPDATVIGEVWEDASNKIAYGERRKYFQGKELDGVMNYPIKNAIIKFVTDGKAEDIVNLILTQIDHYPKQCLDVCMTILGTHDTERILTALGDRPSTGNIKELAEYRLSENELKIAKDKLKKASLLQYTLCGVPCVYYGDEIGMQGFRDPLNRRFFAWDNQDEELLKWYALLGKIRKIKPFDGGEYQELLRDKSALVFKRFLGGDGVIVAVNCGDDEYDLQYEGCLYNLLNGEKCVNNAKLEKYGMLVLYTENL